MELEERRRIVCLIVPDDPNNPPPDREPCGTRKRVDFMDLKAGDSFELYEPDGTFVTRATATKDAGITDGGLAWIECLEVPRPFNVTPTVDGVHILNTRHSLL